MAHDLCEMLIMHEEEKYITFAFDVQLQFWCSLFWLRESKVTSTVFSSKITSLLNKWENISKKQRW